jgi:hypothetical protein
MWQLLEPVHAVTYFDPVATGPLRQRGVEGFWTAYLLQRAAPLGPVGPAVLSAAELARVEALLAPLADAVWARSLMPPVNPVGVTPASARRRARARCRGPW